MRLSHQTTGPSNTKARNAEMTATRQCSIAQPGNLSTASVLHYLVCWLAYVCWLGSPIHRMCLQVNQNSFNNHRGIYARKCLSLSPLSMYEYKGRLISPAQQGE